MRGRLSKKDSARIRAIGAELETIRVGGPDVLDVILPELRAVLGTATFVAIHLSERSLGWEIDLLHQEGFADPDYFVRVCETFFPNAPSRYAWYNAVSPEPQQRNRVIEAIGHIPPGELEASAIHSGFLVPLKVNGHRQLRALVCDGPALLAWFGSFHPEPLDARQYRVLTAVLPSVRRRLAIEQRIRAAPRAFAALAVALDYLGAPSFVLDRRGEIHEMNRSATALLASRHKAVRASLKDAVARRPSELAFELTQLRDKGTSVGWLAVLRSAEEDARTLEQVALAAARWRLSRRQTDVLGLLARGMSNLSIAAELGIGERAVELHVSALLDRAGVDSRAALVARILSG